MARLRTHLGRGRRGRLTTRTLTPYVSAKSVAEHEGRLPQPGVPSGPRNTPSASAHYHSDLSIPGYQPSTPTTAPPPGEAATAPAGDYAGAHRAYTRAVAALPPPAQLAPPVAQSSTLASILNPLGAVLGLNPGITSAAGATLSSLLSPDAQQPGISEAVALKEAPKSPVDPRDPLGAKTLGDVTAAQLAQAGKQRTLQINQGDKLTIPVTRRAARDLAAARGRVAQSSGIAGITHGEAATRFADALARYTGLDPRFVGAWVQAEGAGETGTSGGEAGRNNWLGVGYPAHRTPFSESPYFNGSPERAARATAEWIEGKIGGDYGYQAASTIQNIIPMAAHKGADAALSALEQSGWGTNVDSIRQNLGMISAQPSDPQAIQQLTSAKRAAKELGIPTAPASAAAQSHYLQVFGHQVARELELVKSGQYDKGPGSLVVGGSDVNYGHEPEIAARLKLLSAKIGKPIYIISGHRTPQHSVEVGGFSNDPHTEGRAADIGVGSALRESAGQISEADYESVGLHRPYYPESSAEINHVELLNGGTPATGGGSAGGAGGGAVGGGGVAVGGAIPASGGLGGAPTGRPAMAPAPLTAISSPLAAGPVMPSELIDQESEAHGSHALETIEALLGENPASPTGRPRLG